MDYKLLDVFGKTNAKMGEHVLTFSIPAILSCPGRSSVCESLCYADKNFFKYANVKSKHHRTWELTKKSSFPKIATELLKTVPENTLFRLHVAGDFYSEAYARKWLEILEQSPHIRAWVYTRSWRIPEIYEVIKKLARLDNLTMWFSCDKETGRPSHIPGGVRMAYMMVEDDDIPRYRPDLYFRDYGIRKSPMKYVSDTLVCPAENGVSGHVQCEKCQICMSDPEENPSKRTHKRDIEETLISRISLPVI